MENTVEKYYVCTMKIVDSVLNGEDIWKKKKKGGGGAAFQR